jgi:hypothetical protein
MNKARSGISQRAYARHAGVSGPYVAKLIKQGKLPTLPDGSLDSVACDVARSRNTNVIEGILRKRRRAALNRLMPKQAQAWLRCAGCGEQYRPSEAANSTQRSPDPSRYCCDLCGTDAAAGLSKAQIRRKDERNQI